MNTLTRLLLWCVLLSFPVAVVAQEPEPFQGIWCESADQIKQVVAKGTELGGAQQGIDAVNTEVGGTTRACVFAVVLGVRGKEQDIVDSPEGKLAVIPFLIVAVGTPMGILPAAEQTVWFTVAEPKGQGV